MTRSTEAEEKVELEEDYDPEETVEEEEVEYEEVEEEVEETDEEEEVEEEEEDSEGEDAITGKNSGSRDQGVDMEMKEVSDDEKKRHAELLALPPHGSEVFLGGIPNDATEEQLRAFCESVGEITEIRVMKGKHATENKGYAFVMFKTKDMASKAMETLNNAEMKGKKIKCSSSQAKHKLFIRNIPKTWGEEDLRKAVTEIGPGVTTIELLKDPQNSSRNRGFVFIEYYNHACAEYSRQKMSSPNFKLADSSPTVSWADPKNTESSSSSTSQVKALYVKNLPKDITQEKLKELFGRHGKISKVALPPAKPGQENSRFGFVHYVERSSTMKALKSTERYEIDGRVVECSLAKPQAEQKAPVSNSQSPGLMPTYLPRVGYGMVGGAFGSVGAGYAAPALTQPFFYAGGAPPAMMPMLLPDGRIGYVLQQPEMHPQMPMHPRGGRGSSSRGGSGSSSGGRRGGGASNHGRSRYNPY